MEGDDFEWNDRKAAINFRRHKVSFQTACDVFNDAFALVEHDLTEEYGEDRFLATGMVGGVLITVAYTERGERIRIISARRANNNEQRKYYQGQTSS